MPGLSARLGAGLGDIPSLSLIASLQRGPCPWFTNEERLREHVSCPKTRCLQIVELRFKTSLLIVKLV